MIRRYTKKIAILAFSAYLSGGMAQPAAAEYNAADRRDPFVPLVGATAKAVTQGLQGVVSPENISFEGVITGAGGKKVAVLNGEMYSAGYRTGNVSVESVSDNEVVLIINDKKYKVKLYE
jgi:hypothetical protein